MAAEELRGAPRIMQRIVADEDTLGLRYRSQQPGRNAALVSPEYRLPQIGMAPHVEYE